jgi:hypothetical protein
MRAPNRRGTMLCTAALAAAIAVAMAAAQSADSRADSARRIAGEMFEQWLGTPPSPPASKSLVRSAWPPAPATMDVESAVAFDVARRWWPAESSPLVEGAAAYLESRAVARMFDLSFGRAGAGADSARLFGGAVTLSFPQLRLDGPASGLGRNDFDSPRSRGAHAFASLERLIGQPRLVGALRSVAEQRPRSDEEVSRLLNDALGQDVSWLFASVDPANALNYAIANVVIEACAPSPCLRVRVAVVHYGAAWFDPIDVRVEFDGGQSAEARWDGRSPSRSLVFEGPSNPVRIVVDPEARNLMDDNLLDQSRQFYTSTNVPLTKWVARWLVWLQDAMLVTSAIS